MRNPRHILLAFFLWMPPLLAETLTPAPVMTVKVAAVQCSSDLGEVEANRFKRMFCGLVVISL